MAGLDGRALLVGTCLCVEQETGPVFLSTLGLELIEPLWFCVVRGQYGVLDLVSGRLAVVRARQ